MLLVFLGLVVMVLVVYKFYGRIYETNVSLESDQELFYIPTGSNLDACYVTFASTSQFYVLLPEHLRSRTSRNGLAARGHETGASGQTARRQACDG